MGVLIKGMEMPENCGECPLTYEALDVCCCADPEGREVNVRGELRPEWCPLEEFHLIEFRGFTGAGPENVVVGLGSMASANRFDDLLRRRVKKAAEKICDEIMENVKKEMQEEVKKAREIDDGR
jgi:hypothetical protein